MIKSFIGIIDSRKGTVAPVTPHELKVQSLKPSTSYTESPNGVFTANNANTSALMDRRYTANTFVYGTAKSYYIQTQYLDANANRTIFGLTAYPPAASTETQGNMTMGIHFGSNGSLYTVTGAVFTLQAHTLVVGNWYRLEFGVDNVGQGYSNIYTSSDKTTWTLIVALGGINGAMDNYIQMEQLDAGSKVYYPECHPNLVTY